MKITFIQTGGTIDKDYPKTSKGYSFEFGEPAMKRVLAKIFKSFEYEVLTAFQKDSLEIEDSDREELSKLLGGLDTKHIVITHGTDTLIETAQFLEAQQLNKVIVITGAMRPQRFSNSDADFNIGAAVSAVQILDPGVFVTMSGIVKRASSIKRDLQTGKFY